MLALNRAWTPLLHYTSILQYLYVALLAPLVKTDKRKGMQIAVHEQVPLQCPLNSTQNKGIIQSIFRSDRSRKSTVSFGQASLDSYRVIGGEK